jgi:hypothetical protein
MLKPVTKKVMSSSRLPIATNNTTKIKRRMNHGKHEGNPFDHLDRRHAHLSVMPVTIPNGKYIQFHV